MPRRSTDVITRFVSEYAGLSDDQRNQVAAAIRGYQIGSGRVENVTKTAPRRRTTARVSSEVPAPASN